MQAERTWRARILDPVSGDVRGAAILIDQRRILTAAHVVLAATLDPAARLAVPDQTVQVDFPQSGDNESYYAQVIPGGWFPERNLAGDLAILEVLGTAPTIPEPAPLRLAGESERGMVRAFGHPPGHETGVWARARMIGRGGPQGEWIQLDGLSQTGKRIQKGFSGAGVWDDENQAVIGCVVVEDRQEADRVAWMVPTEVIADYWPELRTLIQRGPGTPAGRAPEQRPIPGPPAGSAP